MSRPPGAVVTDLGDRTLLPGLIDAHVHLFLHPGAGTCRRSRNRFRSEPLWRCWQPVTT